jgi:hypothetical protein
MAGQVKDVSLNKDRKSSDEKEWTNSRLDDGIIRRLKKRRA